MQLIRQLNSATLDPADQEFSARINAYDLAFKMQTEAPDILDLSREPRETLDLYGIGAEPTHDYGRRCLLRGGWSRTACGSSASSRAAGRANKQWDAHTDIEENHLRKAAETDKPVAGLLKDLKRRGLLESTLVLWGGEFGRSPEAESGKGRDHHNLGFTCGWPAAASKGARSSVPPTQSACTRSRDPIISATSTRRSCTSSGSTSSG